MTFLRIVIPFCLFVGSMIFSENRCPLFRIMLYCGILRELIVFKEKTGRA